MDVMSYDNTSHTQWQNFYQYLTEQEPEITRSVEKVIFSVGGSMAERNHVLKSLSSIENKLFRLYGNAEWSPLIYQLSDLIRYTCIVSEEAIPEILDVFLNGMKQEGFTILKIEDYFRHPKAGTHYKGLHVDLMAPCGVRVEIQVHTPASYQAKRKAHFYYQMVRTGQCSKRKRKKALRQQRLVFDLV